MKQLFFLFYMVFFLITKNFDMYLFLADGVAYAKKDLKCDIILDICTLTGAQVIILFLLAAVSNL